MIIAIFCLSGFVFGTFITSQNQNNAYAQTKQMLQQQNYTVVQGIINSPTVIQTTQSYSYFVSAVPHTMQVYQVDEIKGTLTNGAFIAVFNATYGLAYTPPFKTQLWW